MTTFTRANAWNNGGTFENLDLLWYARAVGAMKLKPISNPTSWWFYAAIHGEYLTSDFGTDSAPSGYPNWTKISSIPESAKLGTLPDQNFISLFWNQCQHGTWFFPPWHRGYLVALENLLRDTIVQLGGPSDWALPYWNYMSQSLTFEENYIPPAFTAIELPDGTANPLYVPERYGVTGNPTNGIFLIVGTGLTNSINDECQWDTLYSSGADSQEDPQTPTDQEGITIFGDHYGGAQTGFSHSNGGFGDLEMNPHNFVHGMVGGLNSEFWSFSGTNFTVQANQPWQSTGINIVQGSSTVVVSFVSGAWTADPNDNGGKLYDANGSPDIVVPVNQPLYPMVNVAMGALVGRVNGGTPFLIGDGAIVPNGSSGLLEVCINDDLTGAYGAGLTDNTGAVKISLTSTPSEEYEGLMADPGLAGLDPIFFLHHANIDRMWAAWNETGKNENPKDLNWLHGPRAQGNSQFAMPLDSSGKSWYYTPEDVNSTTDLKYYNQALYSYTYDDLSLTSYSKVPPATAVEKSVLRLSKLGVTVNPNDHPMPSKSNAELVGASSNSIKLNSGTTQASVALDASAWKTVSKSLLKASLSEMPDEVYLLLENVTGTNNANFLSVFVNGTLVKTVSLFGIRMASMKNTAHGGSGLTFKFNITSIVDDLHLANNLTLEALHVEIKTSNPLPNNSEITVGRIGIYRSGK
ncbi:hypothetical protein FVB9288_03219 [Flavobacterium sp. CECT 9288]|uniref:DUF7868 domain-containing protein n=1 Tax=Flavobacterium sp. CECT 9288 TaxID=2845819 RepID=UPI001E2DC351|nr:tyrosinase family protein [Flavobacterium sp. CECT 9288]CAH0337457.1 hypothetical protein FVB9288_03219 [Flavobacterium sp. CECT 9288]